MEISTIKSARPQNKNLLKGGKRGNKGGTGRPKLEVTEIAAKYTQEAVERLAFWMRSGDASASVKAAQILIERVDGKALQKVMPVDGEGNFAPYSLTVKIDDPAKP